MPAPGAPSSSPGTAGMLAPFFGELDRIAPSFKVDGSQIHILRTPTEFYETLKVGSVDSLEWLVGTDRGG